jgi:hypothetical protein
MSHSGFLHSHFYKSIVRQGRIILRNRRKLTENAPH